MQSKTFDKSVELRISPSTCEQRMRIENVNNFCCKQSNLTLSSINDLIEYADNKDT